MAKPHRQLPTFGGRGLGLTVLVGLQLLIGAIHLASGLLLLSYEDFAALPAAVAYDVYTFLFGLLVVFFAVGIWNRRRWGWVGSVAVSVFVIVADCTAVAGVPIVAGTPAGPAAVEIGYSVVLIAALFWGRIRRLFF